MAFRIKISSVILNPFSFFRFFTFFSNFLTFDSVSLSFLFVGASFVFFCGSGSGVLEKRFLMEAGGPGSGLAGCEGIEGLDPNSFFTVVSSGFSVSVGAGSVAGGLGLVEFDAVRFLPGPGIVLSCLSRSDPRGSAVLAILFLPANVRLVTPCTCEDSRYCATRVVEVLSSSFRIRSMVNQNVTVGYTKTSHRGIPIGRLTVWPKALRD